MKTFTTDELLDKKNMFVVIGASNNEEKFGYKVYKQLKDLNYKVFPVNPREELIMGDKCYDNLYRIKKKSGVKICLVFVVPPEIALKVTETAIELKYKIFWYQPGSFDKAVISYHEGKKTQVINDRCILVETSQRAV